MDTVLEQLPPEGDRPCACWTLRHLRTAFLGIVARPFCQITLRRTVLALGFRWRRPRLWARQEDPETFEKQFLVELARQQAVAATPRGPGEGPADLTPVHFL